MQSVSWEDPKFTRNVLDMRKALMILLLFIAGVAFAQDELHWETNFEKAQESAKANSKFILMSFQGSDWCANCRRLEKTLFESEEFKKLAKEKFVLLKLDFPVKKQNKLPKEQAAYNDKMAEKYNKTGSFPKVLIFDNQGNQKGEMALASPMLEAYLKSLNTLIN